MTGTIPVWATILVSVITTCGGTVAGWVLRRIDQAGKPDPALSKRLDQVDASLTQLDQRLDPLQDGVKTMLLCKLEQMQREMVDAGGIADNDLKPAPKASTPPTTRLVATGTAPKSIRTYRTRR